VTLKFVLTIFQKEKHLRIVSQNQTLGAVESINGSSLYFLEKNILKKSRHENHYSYKKSA